MRKGGKVGKMTPESLRLDFPSRTHDCETFQRKIISKNSKKKKQLVRFEKRKIKGVRREPRVTHTAWPKRIKSSRPDEQLKEKTQAQMEPQKWLEKTQLQLG